MLDVKASVLGLCSCEVNKVEYHCATAIPFFRFVNVSDVVVVNDIADVDL